MISFLEEAKALRSIIKIRPSISWQIMDSHKKPVSKCADALYKGSSFLSILCMLFTVLLFLRMEAINRKTDLIDQRVGRVENDLKMATVPRTEHKDETDVLNDTMKNTKSRTRRSFIGDANRSLTLEEVRLEITKQLGKINPGSFCQPSEKVCVPGPPGTKGNRGSRGKRGAQGAKGKKGSQGIVGLPGRHGKQGMIGNPGTKGQQGEKGGLGPRGLPGLKGDPGESISAPEVIVSPESQTVTENQTASFYCSANGHPRPKVTWKKLSGSFIEGHVFTNISEGKLEIGNATYNASGQYTCTAVSVLGQDEKTVQLVVEVGPKLTKAPERFLIIDEGATALISCEAFSHPPSTIQWTRPLTALPKGRSTVINGTLKIHNFSTADTGSYICTARNKLGATQAITTLSIRLKPRVSCENIVTRFSRKSSGTYELTTNSLKFMVYCDMTTDRRGWTLIARFSNSDSKTWMSDTGYWWYDQQVAMGTPTNPSVNADMISPAFWLVGGREFKITRSDDSSHTPLLQTTENCLSGQTFRSKVTSYGDFRNGKVWSSDKCLRSCMVQYGGQYKSTDGFQQAECSSDIQSANKIGLWCHKGGDGSVMMIGGGGSSCSRADHGIGITEENAASFVDHGRGEYDFGYNAGSAPSTSYSLNLWIR